MKPPPPRTLLPRGHEWRVVPADGWEVRTGLQCQADVGMDRYRGCGRPCVAVDTSRSRPHSTAGGFRPRCAKHLGSIRWVEDGQVVAWRAVISPGSGEMAAVVRRDRRHPSEATA